MANGLQKLIYNMSVASPLLIVFAFVWYIQKKNWTIPIICVVVAIVLILCMLKSFSYGKKHLAPIQIRTNDIAPSDGWIVVYIITYILPFASMIIDDFNLIVGFVVAATIAVIAAHVNTAIPNPILFCQRYHFYSVGAENGISGYVLISRRKLRKKQDLKAVNRVFEFLLLDTEG